MDPSNIASYSEGSDFVNDTRSKGVAEAIPDHKEGIENTPHSWARTIGLETIARYSEILMSSSGRKH
jgi:hypothetical protein